MISKTKTPAHFYQDLAENYDDMTRYSSRISSEKKTLEQLIKKLKFKTALDAACGTGLHAILLQKLGIDVIGMDISQRMLEKAQRNAEKLGVSLPWIQSSLQNMTRSIERSFDIIFCLGNSLPHVNEKRQLKNVMKQFYQLLNPEGRVLLQTLNYDKIIDNKERIIQISKHKRVEYIRFYDFYPKKIQFNILQIDWERNPPSHSLLSTPIYPCTKSELQQAFQSAGFNSIQYYGDLKLAKFSKARSRNLIVLAQKSS